MLKMWPGTHILKRTVGVEPDLGFPSFGKLKAILNLILLASSLQVFDSLGNAPFGGRKRLSLSYDLTDASLDLLKIFRGKWGLKIKIVVAAVADWGTKRKLGVWSNFKHCLSHDMR
jgi:hypothetical protein